MTQNALLSIQTESFVINLVPLAKQGDNALGSIHLSVRLSVCPLPLSHLNRLTHNHYYQSKVIVCVSVISGCMQIIVRMWSIGFYFYMF